MVSLDRRRILVLLVPLAALLVLAGQRLLREQRSPPAAAPVVAERQGAGAIASEPARIVVHVSGAVEEPGLYRLPEGSRVADAVARAGGLKPRADLAVVNLAAPLADGEHVLVARRPPTDGASGAEGAATGGKVQLSTATAEQLDSLPGIGPVTAQKIVDWRAANGPFRSVDDLDAIPGIGPARVEQLRDLVIP